MKILDLIDNNSVTVHGEPGKDKVPANVPEGSFVVPVNVTAGEKIIPPGNVPKVDAAIKQYGGNGIQDLAPKSKNVLARVPILDKDGKPTGEFRERLIPRPVDVHDNKGLSESQLYDKNTTVKAEPMYTKNAFVDYKELAENKNGYFKGGYVDANGNYVEDGEIKAPEPIDFKTATPEQLTKYAEDLNRYNSYLDANIAQTQGNINTLKENDAKAAARTTEAIAQAPQSQQVAPAVQPEVKPATVQPVAQAATPQAPAVVQNNEYQQAIDDTINNSYKNLVDENSGTDVIESNLAKVQKLLGDTTPVFDEKKAERLKRVAAINSIGQALSTGFGGYIGSKGGPILDTRSNITPAALAEYQKMIEEDKQYKYRTGIMQAQEAVKGMHDIAVNELSNRRMNQAQLAKAQLLADKFKLDKYANDEKYRRDVDLALLKYGINATLIAQRNDYDAKKTALEIKERMRLAQADAPEGMVAFYNPKTGKREYIERSKAMYIIGKAKQERDTENNPVYKMEDLITKPDKYNQEEMGLAFYDLLQKYGGSYETPSDPLGIIDDAKRQPDTINEEDPDADLLLQ